MSLIVEVTVNRQQEVGNLIIQRMEDFRGDDAVHMYRAGIVEPGDMLPQDQMVRVFHKYSDGAWVLICKSLKALNLEHGTDRYTPVTEPTPKDFKDC